MPSRKVPGIRARFAAVSAARARTATFAAIVLLGSSFCGTDKSPTGLDDNEVTGLYNLHSVIGDTQSPWNVITAIDEQLNIVYFVDILDGTLNVRSNGTWSYSFTMQTDVDLRNGTILRGTPRTQTGVGTWDRDGETMTFTNTDNGDANATGPGVMTIVEAGILGRVWTIPADGVGILQPITIVEEWRK